MNTKQKELTLCAVVFIIILTMCTIVLFFGYGPGIDLVMGARIAIGVLFLSLVKWLGISFVALLVCAKLFMILSKQNPGHGH